MRTRRLFSLSTTLHPLFGCTRADKGGYLIYRLWPSVRVFDDGRTDFYGPGFVEEGLRAWDARPDWAEIFAKYRVNAALVPVDSALAAALRERADWELVYSDRVALMFVKIDNQK